MSPYSFPLIGHYTLNILIHTGKGGRRGELTREKVRGAIVHKAGPKIPT
jgi:hypothetical protein